MQNIDDSNHDPKEKEESGDERRQENATPLEEHEHEANEMMFSLTRNEALFLDDSFTLMLEREHDEGRIFSMRPVRMTAGLAVPLDMMDKIGKAVAFTTSPANQAQEYVFPVDITELYMIREVGSSFITIGDEPVGYNLKRKVCALLYSEAIKQESRNEMVDQILKDINIDLEAVIPDENGFSF